MIRHKLLGVAALILAAYPAYGDAGQIWFHNKAELWLPLAVQLHAEPEADPIVTDTSTGRLYLTISSDQEFSGPITVGFFQTPDWRQRPKFIRQVEGLGRHVFNGIPKGRFFLGCVADPSGQPDTPGTSWIERDLLIGTAIGWPSAVSIDDGIASAHIALGLHEHDELAPRAAYLQSWTTPTEHLPSNEEQAIVRSVDSSDRPVPFCRLTITFLPSNTQLKTGTNSDGLAAFSAKSGEAFVVHVERDEFIPDNLAVVTSTTRHEARWESATLPVPIHVAAFEPGSATLRGTWQDQHGRAVNGSITLRSKEMGVAYCFPVLESSGAYKVTGLQQRNYDVLARPFGWLDLHQPQNAGVEDPVPAVLVQGELTEYSPVARAIPTYFAKLSGLDTHGDRHINAYVFPATPNEVEGLAKSIFDAINAKQSLAEYKGIWNTTLSRSKNLFRLGLNQEAEVACAKSGDAVVVLVETYKDANNGETKWDFTGWLPLSDLSTRVEAAHIVALRHG